MESLQELRLSKKFQEDMRKSRLKNIQSDPITMHCKRDHLSPSPFYHSKNSSSYHMNFTPEKDLTYNNPQVEQEFRQKRKREDRDSQISNLPNILENSSYQKSFQSQQLEKIPKGKQKDSWFLKMGWALEPTSHYQKDYLQKNGSTYNKSNFQRPNNNNLAVFNFKEGNKRISNYMTSFQANNIKKEAQITQNKKEDLLCKQNVKGQLGLQQYQKRYDSMMEKAKSKDSLFSIYRKQSLPRGEKPKN